MRLLHLYNRMWRYIVLLSIIKNGLCGFFDYTEFDDPFNLAYFARNVLVRQHHGRCTGITSGGASREGMCLLSHECRLAGGSPRNRNGCLLGYCCVFEKGCGQRTNKRISYFESPGNVDLSCDFTVDVENDHICQMRLDFELFELAQPRRLGVVPPGAIEDDSAFLCRDELFKVAYPTHYRTPIICGVNDGQHMYVTVNATAGERSMQMSVQRINNSVTTNSRWRIKITQLECPSTTKVQKTRRLWEDFPWLAPAGCTQYYLNRTGQIWNFGYNRNRDLASNRYIGEQDYAICIRRAPDVCGIRYYPGAFRLSDYSLVNDGQCLQPGTTNIDADFLFIPDGRYTDNAPTTSRFCDQSFDAPNTEVTSRMPGPIYVRFRTDNLGQTDLTQDTTENGFWLNYAQFPCV